VLLFLGAGVNLCGRQASEPFEAGLDLPSGSELAAYLASKVGGFPCRRSEIRMVRTPVPMVMSKS
jgi:hypothetical protein